MLYFVIKFRFNRVWYMWFEKWMLVIINLVLKILFFICMFNFIFLKMFRLFFLIDFKIRETGCKLVKFIFNFWKNFDDRIDIDVLVLSIVKIGVFFMLILIFK